jgi:hypothetical protein
MNLADIALARTALARLGPEGTAADYFGAYGDLIELVGSYQARKYGRQVWTMRAYAVVAEHEGVSLDRVRHDFYAAR